MTNFSAPDYPKQETDIENLIRQRISNRAFHPDRPVPKELWKEILSVATRAPSWKNAQSYKIVIVSGQKKSQLAQELREAASAKRQAEPAIPYESDHPDYIQKRMKNLGIALYQHLGIERKDTERRREQALSNYDGFGAPHMLFFYIPSQLRDWSILDLGIMVGYLSLVITQYGLGSCIQAMLGAYPDIVAKYTGMDESHKLIVGMSVGYPIAENPSNTFYSDRVPVNEIMEWIE